MLTPSEALQHGESSALFVQLPFPGRNDIGFRGQALQMARLKTAQWHLTDRRIMIDSNTSACVRDRVSLCNVYRANIRPTNFLRVPGWTSVTPSIGDFGV